MNTTLLCPRHPAGLWLVWVCVLFYVFAGRAAASELVDRIVAVVNDDIILLSDLKREMKPYEERLHAMGYSQEQERQMQSSLRTEILDKLIDERITDQQIDRQGISVSREDVDAAIARMKAAQGLTDAQLKTALSQEGLTLDAYRKQLREQLLRSKLLDYEIKSKIVVTEEDILRFYEDHPEEFGGEKKYHLRTIIMRVPSFANDAEKDRVRQKMAEVYRLLERGADFAEMARRYSESGLAAEGGDLGLFKLDEIAPRFREALEDKPVGGYTSILDTEQGFQIFYIEDIVKTPPKAFEEVSAEIQNRLYQQQVNEKFSAWLEELRESAHIKVIQ